jgi:uncharacterized protein YeaO (DUF488 family)
MPIKTKRWNDPKDADEVLRILVCRYRPRGLPKQKETCTAGISISDRARSCTPPFTARTAHP